MSADEDFKSSKARDSGAETCWGGDGNCAPRVCGDDSKNSFATGVTERQNFQEVTGSQTERHWQQDVEHRFLQVCREFVLQVDLRRG